MEKLKKFFTSIPGIIFVFILAAVPLIYGGVGSARAALTYRSENYVSQVQLKDIGITIVENDEDISNRDYANTDIETADGTWNENTRYLLAGMPAQVTKADGTAEKNIIFNHPYREELKVKNTGNIPEYVRVTVYKYWTKLNEKTGEYEKTNALSPALIDLELANIGGDWILDEQSTTPERVVLYYKKILEPGKTTDSALSSTLTIKGDLKGNVRTFEKDGEKITSYKFDDYKFILEATADGVQTHNPEPAMLSAWGRNITISNDVITNVK